MCEIVFCILLFFDIVGDFDVTCGNFSAKTTAFIDEKRRIHRLFTRQSSRYSAKTCLSSARKLVASGVFGNFLSVLHSR